MQEQPPGENQTQERRIGILYERLAAMEKVVELSLEAKSDRMRALETVVSTALDGKGGVLERLTHLDDCIDSVKKTIWMATGALALISTAMNLITRGH